MSFDIMTANLSDALIIHHRDLKWPLPNLSRKDGQIWIMIQHEASNTYSNRYSSVWQVCSIIIIIIYLFIAARATKGSC